MPPSDEPHAQSDDFSGLRPQHVSKDFLSAKMQDFLTYVRMHDSETTILVLHVSPSRT